MLLSSEQITLSASTFSSAFLAVHLEARDDVVDRLARVNSRHDEATLHARVWAGGSDARIRLVVRLRREPQVGLRFGSKDGLNSNALTRATLGSVEHIDLVFSDPGVLVAQFLVHAIVA